MRHNDSMDWDNDTFAGRSSPQSMTLTMRQGPNPGRRFTTRKSNVTVGRLPTNDVAISDQQISRHHANITWENGQFIIRDLGSANGTAVNGITITAPCPLRDGDVISFGEIVLTFQGSTGESDANVSTYSRNTDASMATFPKGPALIPDDPLTGTIEMRQSHSFQSRSNTMWPILVGIGLALFLALIFAAVILIVVLSQTGSIPEIAVQQPLSGSQAQLGQAVVILASATDRKGVARVEIWADGDLQANITSDNPVDQNILMVQHPWVPTSSGIHNLSLKAYNTMGKASQPQNIEIRVAGQTPDPVRLPTQTPTPTTMQMVQATVTPTGFPITVPTPTIANCINDTAFVADVTVPDNTVFQPGARIDKTWRIRNSGACPWGTGYRLVFVSGNKMGAPDNQPAVPTAPGGTTDVTVTMYAPTSYGTHTGVWRMIDANGEPFGQRFTIVIQVPSPYTPTPIVTPTYTPLPGPLISITADRDQINAGECTRIRASVEGVKAAWVNGEAIAGGYMEKEVCPCEETKYTLDAQLENGDHVTRDVTIRVEGSCIVSKPDLVIRDLVEVDGNTNPKVDETIHFRLRIKNVGTVTARDIASSWRPFGEDSGEIIEHNIDRLDPNEDKNFYWDYTYKETGEFKTHAKVDYLNRVDEADEDNNTETLTIDVRK